ncbi:MAG: peptide chain release factor N(5)-glutamine methyltransferase [Candidatus Parcubacteria bacterium]|nr:peptide chain release factor N(5)-glutamine methyltransferase [Candidatus Parcubacteria bacterium]
MATSKKEENWLLNEKYQGKECPEFFEDIKRIENGKPIDYVIGFTEFLGAKIDLSFHPLIPRQETEYWVEKAIKEMPAEKLQVLDLFAGSGCIGVALLKNLPDIAVDFGEKDLNLIPQIEKNLAINNIAAERARVFTTDVFSYLPPKKYDYIFANPPYISKDKKEQVADSVMKYEPHLALFADDDGLFFIKKLLNESPNFLSPKGKLFIEFDAWQKEKIAELIKESKFQGEFRKDQFDTWRVIVCTL